MRRISLLATTFLLLAFASAPAVSATDVTENESRVAEVIPQVQSSAQTGASELNLTKVQVETRTAADEAAAAQFAPRGSFWWVVGVIVVAGVILAIVV